MGHQQNGIMEYQPRSKYQTKSEHCSYLKENKIRASHNNFLWIRYLRIGKTSHKRALHTQIHLYKLQQQQRKNKSKKSNRLRLISTASLLLNLLPLLLGELIYSRLHSIMPTDEQSGNNFRIRLEPGLLELLPRVLSQDISPKHAPRVGPHEEPSRPDNVTIQAQCLPPSAGESPPVQQLLLLIVEVFLFLHYVPV